MISSSPISPSSFPVSGSALPVPPSKPDILSLSHASSCSTFTNSPVSPSKNLDPESLTAHNDHRGSQRRRFPTGRLLSYLRQPLTGPSNFGPLLVNAFITGLLDSASFVAWSTFLSMQTGNTVFLALGASGHPVNNPLAWIRSLTSILSFILGTFCFSRGMRALGGERKSRASLAASFAVQVLFLIIGGILVQTEVGVLRT